MKAARDRPGRRRLLLAAASAAALAACGIDQSGQDLETCATVLSYTEPVLTITEVRDSDGQPVREVEVVRYRLDGGPQLERLRFDIEDGTSWRPDRDVATSDAALHSGLTLGADDRVTCEVPCAFGSIDGTVDLRVVADDGQQVARSIEVGYGGRAPGCGGAALDGTDVDLVLARPPGAKGR